MPDSEAEKRRLQARKQQLLAEREAAARAQPEPEAAAPAPALDDAPTAGAGPAPSFEPGAEPLPPREEGDAATRDLLRNLRKQQKVALEQKLAEAHDLEARAKELSRRVKQQQRLRQEATKHADYVRSLSSQLGFDPGRPITEVPPFADHLTQVEFTTVQEGRSFVRVLFDARSNRYIYEALEPRLSNTEREVLEFIRDTLVRTLDARAVAEADAQGVLVDAIDRAIVDHSILVDDVSKQRVVYYLVRDFLGYGPIDVLMRDPMIEDISCDGPKIPIYLFHRQYESIRTNIAFANEPMLDAFVIRLSQQSGKHISIAEPLLDATLPDTSRLQASLSKEVTTRGSSFTIRKFRSDPLTPPDLVRLGTFNASMAAYFWLAMEEGNSLILAGGTASGKTTSLNAVCQFIPPEKKVVSIEDTREINLQHENWIAGLTRSGFGGEVGVNGKQAGSIDMYKLLEAALRQRPEYLLVGEVRGPEALTLFQAMATGHATYSTMHADSASSAVYRLENPPINVPRIMLQTVDAIAVQVQARLNKRMVRRIKEVTEIVGIDAQSGDLLTNAVFVWDNKTDSHVYLGKSRVLDRMMEKNNLTAEEVEAEWARRTDVVQWMVDKGIRHITDVANVVSAYYSAPDQLLAKVREHHEAKQGGAKVAA
ncbi:MAG TPA: type II/IV secretion system ATPase subunit [Candidatus Thermoplasmatota archaeon]|jgi:flagellar protein FlaI|nr:type II/IV secretion system ATPase subunit [Candidatus Thermoplasmatota archaeon]